MEPGKTFLIRNFINQSVFRELALIIVGPVLDAQYIYSRIPVA